MMKSQTKKKQLSVVCRRDSRDDGNKVAILCPANRYFLVAVECTEGDICCFASIYIGLPSNNPRRPSLG